MDHAFEHVDLPRLDNIARGLAGLPTETLSIGLVGTLGAGKTTFVKRLAAAMGVDQADVTSPTFTLQQSYDVVVAAPADRDLADRDPVHRRLNHLDAYRINDLDAWDELGIDELHETPGHWTLIEWADQVSASMPRETLWIEFHLTSTDERQIRLRGGPAGVVDAWVGRVAELDAAELNAGGLDASGLNAADAVSSDRDA